MITQQTVNQWLQDYICAWKSYDPQAIANLFSENAVYRYSPYDDGLYGREAIVANWSQHYANPNTYAAEYVPLALNGSMAVTTGRSFYYSADYQTVERQYDHIFVLRFDDEGRCIDFCEWYMQPRDQQESAALVSGA